MSFILNINDRSEFLGAKDSYYYEKQYATVKGYMVINVDFSAHFLNA